MAVNVIWAGALTDSGFSVAAKIGGASARLAVADNPSMNDPLWFGPVAPDADGWVNGSRADNLALAASGLAADTRYWYAIEDDGTLDLAKVGTLRTLPTAGEAASFKLLAASCTGGHHDTDLATNKSNNWIYPRLTDWHPDARMLIHMGDLFYDDIGANDLALYRAAFEAQLARPNFQAMLLKLPIAYMPDDHDIGPDNADKTSPGVAAFQQVYRQLVPHYPLPHADLLYQSFTVARVMFPFSDLRGARDPDSATAPRDMMGPTQLAWFTGLIDSTEAAAIIWPSTSPTIATTAVGDTWAHHAEEIATIAASIAAYRERGAFAIVEGDNHALHGSTTGNPFGEGIPTWGSAALDGWGNYRGGPHDMGMLLGKDHYTAISVEDDGRGIVLTGAGHERNHAWRGRDPAKTAFPAGYMVPGEYRAGVRIG